MKVPISWLKNYININESNLDDLLHRLTLAGTEVESVEIQGNWEGVKVGQVLEISKHPNADRLNLVKVNFGDNSPIDVVCGANNLYVNQKIAFAPVGSKLFSPKSNKMETLKKSKIRGEISNGMICSSLELGLGEDHDGILDLDKEMEIGKNLEDYFSDIIIDFELTPNRPDCLGIYGIAREVSAVTKEQLKDLEIHHNSKSDKNFNNLEIEIEAKDLCKRYMGVAIDGVKIEESPKWLKSALLSIGENPINNIVDITNYVMFEIGQPLHAFDYNKIKNKKIIVRRAKENEKLITLDDESRDLKNDMLVIADSDSPIALAGIKGGKESGIQNTTSTIVLESACFEGGNNRKTANHFDLKSQATLRFEKNLKPELCDIAFNRAINLILQICGGSISSDIIDIGLKEELKVIDISLDKINSILGFAFNEKNIDEIFKKLSFDFDKKNKDKLIWSVTSPFWRPDINIPEDLIEEISRIEGYDSIPATPISGVIPEWKPNDYLEFLDEIADLNVAAGFNEVINYSADSLENLKYFSPEIKENEYIKILNPMSTEVEFMKPSLKSGMLKTLGLNSRNLNRNINLFEIGTTFRKNKNKELPIQEKNLVVGLIGNYEKTVWSKERKIDFFDAKSFLDTFFKNLKINFEISPKNYSFFDPEKGYCINIDNQEVGNFGQISKKICSSFEIKNQEVFILEIEIKKVFQNFIKKSEIKYMHINKFPVSNRDISFIVDESVISESILNETLNNDLIKAIKVIDIYKDDSLGNNKKSLTVRVTYGSDGKTLSGEEIDECEKSFLSNLSKKISFDIRA